MINVIVLLLPFLALAFVTIYFFVRSFPRKIVIVTSIVTVLLFLVGGLLFGASFALQSKITMAVSSEITAIHKAASEQLKGTAIATSGISIESLDRITADTDKFFAAVKPEGILSRFIYSTITSTFNKAIGNKIDFIKFFSNNGVVTIDSLTEGLTSLCENRITSVFRVIRIVDAIILAFFTLYCVVTAMEEKKKKAAQNTLP
jgi:hypothetical protein